MSLYFYYMIYENFMNTNFPEKKMSQNDCKGDKDGDGIIAANILFTLHELPYARDRVKKKKNNKSL